MSDIHKMELIDEGLRLDLEDICQRLQTDESFVIRCVEFGIAEAEGETQAQWQFSFSSVMRLQKACRLQRDLEMDFAGLAMVLDLLEDVEDLRRQMRILEKRLEHWER